MIAIEQGTQKEAGHRKISRHWWKNKDVLARLGATFPAAVNALTLQTVDSNFGQPELGENEGLTAQEAENTFEQDEFGVVPFNSSELGGNIEQIISDRAAVSIHNYELLSSGASVLSGAEFNTTREFPVASAFKSWVALYYLWYMPEDNWSVGHDTDVYKTIVYSNNTTVGRVIAEVGDFRRSQGENVTGNNLEAFNDFLTNVVGLENGIVAFGFDSPIEGLVDTRFGPTQLDGLNGQVADVSNISNTHDLAAGYAFLMNLLSGAEQTPTSTSNDRQTVGQTLLRLLSIKTSTYLSPFEEQFSEWPSAGKDGSLQPGDIANYGAVINDTVILRVAESEYVVVNYMSGGSSGVMASQVAEQIETYLNQKGIQPMEFDFSRVPEAVSLSFEERTGYQEVDRPGQLEVNLNDEVKSQFQVFVTVNSYDGTLTIYDQTSPGNLEEIYRAQALIGTRLELNDALGQRLATRAAEVSGEGAWYDPSAGVYSDQYGLRATLTPNLVAEFVGTTRVDGFAEIDAVTDIALLRALGADGTISGNNSNFTMHVIPPVERFMPRQRELTYAGTDVEISPYWSHGCVNIHPNQWQEISELLNTRHNKGERVLVIFGIPGQDQNRMLRTDQNYSGADDLFFGNNLINRVPN